MRKNFIEIMKEVCEDEGIGPTKLEEILNVPQEELQKYLGGQGEPDVNVMARFCRAFDLSLDYFLKVNMRECITDNLVSVKNSRGKYAIFDKEQGAFLTQYLYDYLMISPCGKHVAFKENDVDDHDRTKRITINNRGEITQYPGYQLVLRGCSFEYGVCPATNLINDKEYLIDASGEVLSDGYEYISSWINVPTVDEPIGCELFRGTKSGSAKTSVILSKNGKVVEFAYQPNTYTKEETYTGFMPRKFIMPDINTISKAVAAIKKYGQMIVTFLPEEVLSVEGNYRTLVDELYSYALKELQEGEAYKTVTDTLKLVFNTLCQLWQIYISGNDKLFFDNLYIETLLVEPRRKYYDLKREKAQNAPLI